MRRMIGRVSKPSVLNSSPYITRSSHCSACVDSSLAEPTGDAHPGLQGGHYFMPEFAGHETNDGAHSRFDQLEGTIPSFRGGPDFQFSSVAWVPVRIEIQDHRHDAVAGSRVAVEMGFVKRTDRVNREETEDL